MRDSSRPGKLRLNLRGRDEDASEERERARLRLVELRVDIREIGREREVRIAEVVVSIELRVERNWRSGEESDEEVDRQKA